MEWEQHIPEQEEQSAKTFLRELGAKTAPDQHLYGQVPPGKGPSRETKEQHGRKTTKAALENGNKAGINPDRTS